MPPSNDDFEGLGLTSEEVAAMEEDEDDQGQTEVQEDQDDAGQDVVDDDESNMDGDKAQDDEPETESDKPEASEKEAPEPETTPDAEDTNPPVGASIKAIDAKYNESMAELEKRLDSGLVEFEDYKKELVTLERDRTRAVVREEMAILEAERTWTKEQNDFFAQHKHLKSNNIVFHAFAGEVNRLLADTAWSKKPGSQILNEAKKAIDSAFGKPPEEKKPKLHKEDTPGEKAVKDAKNASAKASPPKTLKEVPAADTNTDDNTFAYLDKLDGQKYEDAISKLTPAELEAYSKS